MRNKKVVSAICIFLAALMALSLVFTVLGNTGALASQTQIDAIEVEKQKLQEQRADMQSGIDDLKNQKADVLSQKAALDEQNELARQEIELIDEQIEVYTRLIAEKAEEVDAAIETEDAQHETFTSHMRAMEENGRYTYLDILFNCSSLSELLTAIDDISEIMNADKRLYDQYTSAREHTEQVKAEYEKTLLELGDKQDVLNADKLELESQIEEAVKLIVELEEDIEAAVAEYEANAAAEAALQSQLDAIAAEIARQEEEARKKAQEQKQEYTGTGSTATGSYVWPCPASTIVTSPYGWRVHPIFNTERFHAGIDISANEGTAIVAADSGSVSVATYSSSYGNYVMIYHSSGAYTLYAHMSSMAVAAGDTVSQGDTIGYVGSTGWSTGAHLHFEIRSNGSTVDPLGYFSNYTIWE